MNSMKKLSSRGTFLVASLLLSGCANSWHSNPVDNVSNPAHYSYQDVSIRPASLDEKFVRQGSHQQAESVKEIKPGMSQTQVTSLLGSPAVQDHSGGQWEYDIKMQLPDSQNYIICQYKVIFDRKTDQVSAVAWRRQQCLQLVNRTPTPSPEVNKTTSFFTTK